MLRWRHHCNEFTVYAAKLDTTCTILYCQKYGSFNIVILNLAVNNNLFVGYRRPQSWNLGYVCPQLFCISRNTRSLFSNEQDSPQEAYCLHHSDYTLVCLGGGGTLMMSGGPLPHPQKGSVTGPWTGPGGTAFPRVPPREQTK